VSSVGSQSVQIKTIVQLKLGISKAFFTMPFQKSSTIDQSWQFLTLYRWEEDQS